jgi:hypothetical protein
MAKEIAFPDVRIVERLNAGNRPEEQERADHLADQMSYLGIGGSDAHFVSGIARGMTQFPHPIGDEKDLVAALLEGGFGTVRIEDTAKVPQGG